MLIRIFKIKSFWTSLRAESNIKANRSFDNVNKIESVSKIKRNFTNP